jgi:hypothetical protein
MRTMSLQERRISTGAVSVGGLLDGSNPEATPHRITVAQPSWKPQLRSRVRLAATPKRHLADPSLAVAALGATPRRLLGPEIELAGFLFESQVIHDLRVYSQPHRAEVRFYRDNKGLEVDAIFEAADGRWLAAEIKLGHHRVDEAAHQLLALTQKLSPALTPSAARSSSSWQTPPPTCGPTASSSPRPPRSAHNPQRGVRPRPTPTAIPSSRRRHEPARRRD